MWNWQWFSGGRGMFWIATILLVILTLTYIITFVVDPTSLIFMQPQNIDSERIKILSEEYIDSLELKIKKPIHYYFVKYRHQEWFTHDDPEGTSLLGTFHEWNGEYYIHIASCLCDTPTMLKEIVRHEVRHMLVQEMKDEKIIDLLSYTEEIALEDNETYNDLFIAGVELLRNKLTDDK